MVSGGPREAEMKNELAGEMLILEQTTTLAQQHCVNPQSMAQGPNMAHQCLVNPKLLTTLTFTEKLC